MLSSRTFLEAVVLRPLGVTGEDSCWLVIVEVKVVASKLLSLFWFNVKSILLPTLTVMFGMLYLIDCAGETFRRYTCFPSTKIRTSTPSPPSPRERRPDKLNGPSDIAHPPSNRPGAGRMHVRCPRQKDSRHFQAIDNCRSPKSPKSLVETWKDHTLPRNRVPRIHRTNHSPRQFSSSRRQSRQSLCCPAQSRRKPDQRRIAHRYQG